MDAKSSSLTPFEEALKDVCVEWHGEDPGFEDYLKSSARHLLEISRKPLVNTRFQTLASIHKDADYNDILIEMAIDDLNENENGRDN